MKRLLAKQSFCYTVGEVNAMKVIKLFFSIKVYLWLVLSFLLLLCGVWGYGYISGEKSNQQEVSVHTAIESVE
ncbi:hypothetical protein WQ51_06550, partial [Streptococcus suis]